MEGDSGLAGGGECRAPQVAHERSLFEVLQRMVKVICSMAHDGNKLKVFVFDVADKDGLPIRMTLTMLRQDMDVGPPIVVLEPKQRAHELKETVVFGTRPDGSYRSPGCWDDTMEAEYQTFLRERVKASPFWVVVQQIYGDPENGRANYLNRRDDLIADGWVKVK
jgi:hypothetical protein